MNIVHPCDTFAKSAGFASWQVALESMKSGKIVSGYAPQVGKSNLNMYFFSQQIIKEGLLCIPASSDFGLLISVGFREHFNPDKLSRFDAKSKKMVDRVLGSYHTASSAGQ